MLLLIFISPPLKSTLKNMQYLLAQPLAFLFSFFQGEPCSMKVSSPSLYTNSNSFWLFLSLGVPGKPQISGFENAVPEGGTVTLTCTSTGSKPAARLRWYRGDQELEGERQKECVDAVCV